MLGLTGKTVCLSVIYIQQNIQTNQSMELLPFTQMGNVSINLMDKQFFTHQVDIQSLKINETLNFYFPQVKFCLVEKLS